MRRVRGNYGGRGRTHADRGEMGRGSERRDWEIEALRDQRSGLREASRRITEDLHLEAVLQEV